MSHEQLIDVALEFYKAIGTDVAIKLADKLKSGDWDYVVKSTTDPSTYVDAHAYRSDTAAVSFLRKLEDAPTEIDKRQNCLTKWYDAERLCFMTNLRITDALSGKNPDTPFLDFLGDVRKKVSRLLGRIPNRVDIRFGKGSTFQHKGQRYLIPDKLSVTPEMTSQAWVHLATFGESAWARSISKSLFGAVGQRSYDVPLVRGCRWSSVPKTGLTDRAIGIEPTLNLAIQLGIGKHLKGQLKLSGLLLENSQEIHCKLAHKASLDGSLATIDLSSASDTVAHSLVQHVLPFGWYDLFDSVRSPFCYVPDANSDKKHWVKLEKYSSMGNGYTFELETTIFASICRVVADRYNVRLVPGTNFSVYGDDIIVPTEIATECIAALKWCGFLINQDKTFITGPFRESCGGDYFAGGDVRGVFVKKTPTCPAEWFTLHNQLVRLSAYYDLSKVLERVVSYIPTSLRVYGPEDLGDLTLHGPREQWQLKRTFGCLSIRTLQPVPDLIPLERWGDDTYVACKLYGVRGRAVSYRGGITGHRINWVALGL